MGSASASGVLYSVTTISGPPLAVMLSNQGFTKRDFRAALGFIRLAESSFTAVAYAWAGLYSVESLGLVPYIIPSIAIGVPIGAALIQRIRPETFRRVCMSFDAWIVAFGLSNLVKDLHLIESNLAFLILLAVGALDTVLLYRFFTVQLPTVKRGRSHRAHAGRSCRPLIHVKPHTKLLLALVAGFAAGALAHAYGASAGRRLHRHAESSARSARYSCARFS